MSDRVMRLANLVALLVSANEPLTLEHVRQTIQYPDGESGRQAFIRDRKTLLDEGIEIAMTYPEGLNGAAAYRIDPSTYYLPDLNLSDEEQVALNLALASMHLDAGWGQQAAWKLGLSVSDTPVLASLPAADALPALFDAWRKRATASFSYNAKVRELEVWGLLCRDGFWYVIGRDTAAAEQRTYRVDRIEKGGKVKIGVAGSYSVPQGFNPAEAVPADPKQIGGDPPIDVVVEVDELLAAKAHTEAGPGAKVSSMDNGSVQISMTIANRAAFRSWLLGFGDRAAVLAPAEVRDDFVQWLESIELTAS